MTQALPIDPLLPRIVDSVMEKGALVLQAEPGAGKTTRVPPALLPRVEGEIWVLEPRRIAARMAARRVAEERGERPGDVVGWQVRFEDQTSARTRIRFVTEGILTRRLVRDTRLEGVGCVILDEFHERHLEGDLALALLERLRRTERPDLKVVVMSATLDVERVASFLRGAPTIAAPGRTFEVRIEHRPGSSSLEEQVRAAVESTDGDTLVFLPGAAEIRRAIDACAHRRDLALLPLHGSLPPEEQDRALRPANKRKVIFATNVAETSLTVEGVTVVIDSGLARVAGHSTWSGLPFLEVEPISQASAKQRAGRAGRTAPGRCIRLFTQADLEARPAFTSPEIERLDLAQLVLELRAAKIGAIDWLEAPPGHAVETAEKLLHQLGALEKNALTPIGERMLRYPVHPRLARMLVAAEEGTIKEACALAALLGERDAVRGARTLNELLEAPREPSVERVREQLLKRAPRGGASGGTTLAQALLAGYPDRVAQRRGNREVVLADGTQALLDGQAEADFLVAVEAQEKRGAKPAVRLSAPIQPDWILDAFPDAVKETVEVLWDNRTEKVLVTSRIVYGALVLDESAKGTPPAGEVERILRHHALLAGPEKFADKEALSALQLRAAFARSLDPTLPELGDAQAREVLSELVEGRRGFNELRAADLLASLQGRLTHAQRALLDRLAPAEVTLKAGRRVKVHYEPNQPPWIQSRIQDFFGMKQGPAVGGGKVPLVVHLLAPSQRPVQITSDLAGFWVRHYPQIRRELCRRYPKHAWPEAPC